MIYCDPRRKHWELSAVSCQLSAVSCQQDEKHIKLFVLKNNRKVANNHWWITFFYQTKTRTSSRWRIEWEQMMRTWGGHEEDMRLRQWGEEKGNEGLNSETVSQTKKVSNVIEVLSELIKPTKKCNQSRADVTSASNFTFNQNCQLS